MSAAANVVRVAGLELYRYFLTDLLPGIGVGLLVAYYARQYQEMREIAADYAFLAEVAGGFFLVGLILGLGFGAGLVINLLSTIAFARITDSGILAAVAARLQLKGGLRELGDSARQAVELAKTRSRVEMVGLEESAAGPVEVEEVQRRLGAWLYREHPGDFQRIERYSGAAGLCRSLAGVVVLSWLVEAYRSLVGQGLGVSPSWFPVSALALIVLLFGSAYANVHRTCLLLEVGRQRLHEPDRPTSSEGAPDL